MTNPTLLAAFLLGLCAASSWAQNATQIAAPAAKPIATPRPALLPNVPLPPAPVRGEQIPGATGANVDESRVQKTLYVAVNGAENALGTQAQPMNIVAALQSAFADKARGVGVKVVVGPGTYREDLGKHTGDWNPKTPDVMGAPLVIEAQTPGTVILSGSDVWTGWQEGQDGRWTHQTDKQWSIQAKPEIGGYPLIVRREEMVHLNGQRLTPVLEEAQLKPGTFFVPMDAEGKKGIGPVTIVPPAGAEMKRATVEVTMRRMVLQLFNQSNIVLRGLRVEQVGGFEWSGAVSVNLSRNVLIENCRFDGNSSQGLRSGGSRTTLEYARDFTLRGCTFDDNGLAGVILNRTRNLMVEECRFNRNNWRGALGKWHHWHPAGFKFLWVDGVTLRRCEAVGNLATGMWLDTAVVNLRLEDSLIADNVCGVQLEAGNGPMLVARCVVRGNRHRPGPFGQGSGVYISQSPFITLANNVFYDNDVAQVGVWDTYIRRQHPSMDGGADDPPVEVRTVDLVLQNNVFVSRAQQHALHIGDREMDAGRFLASFRSDGNLFWDENGAPSFLVGPVESRRGAVDDAGRLLPGKKHIVAAQPIDFAAYQRETGQDKNARIADPKFKDPAKGDFSLGPNSPVANTKLPGLITRTAAPGDGRRATPRNQDL